MPITTCTCCGKAYDEQSEEASNEPGRMCISCWAMARLKRAETDHERTTKVLHNTMAAHQGHIDRMEACLRAVCDMVRLPLDGTFTPGPRFHEKWSRVREAMIHCGFCWRCESFSCHCEEYHNDN